MPDDRPLTPDERRQLEELYRQQISAVRSLARILGLPCPLKDRDERRATTRDALTVMVHSEQ